VVTANTVVEGTTLERAYSTSPSKVDKPMTTQMSPPKNKEIKDNTNDGCKCNVF